METVAETKPENQTGITAGGHGRGPREWTTEEVRAMFLSAVRENVNFWEAVEGKNTRERLNGLAFTLLALLDGESGLPGFTVAPSPNPDDRAYCEKAGQNYFPESPPTPHDIAGSLHELFYR